MVGRHYATKVPHACEHCGKVVLYRPCEVKKYCSHHCYTEATKLKHAITRNCAHCGRSFTRPSWLAGEYCSRECANLSKRTDVAERFWAKVDKSGDCWLWQKGIGTDGYAKFWMNGRSVHASRVAYELTYGPIPPGLDICHRCDNKRCVRPDHLWADTCKANSEDMVRKGRSARGERHSSRTHPERVARGERHGSRTHPESQRKGEMHPLAKLTAEKVIDARQRRQNGEMWGVLASRYGVSIQTIRDAVIRKTWQHVP